MKNAVIIFEGRNNPKVALEYAWVLLKTERNCKLILEMDGKNGFGAHQRCVGDMVTKKTRFLRGSTLEATQSAHAPMANSMAPSPSNSSQIPFFPALHLHKKSSRIPINNFFYITHFSS